MSIASINYGSSLLGLSVQNLNNQLSNLSGASLTYALVTVGGGSLLLLKLGYPATISIRP